MPWVYFALGVSVVFNIFGAIAIYLILFYKVNLSEEQKLELIDRLEDGEYDQRLVMTEAIHDLR